MSATIEIYKQSFAYTLHGQLLTEKNREVICRLATLIRKAGVKHHQLMMLQEKLSESKDISAWRSYINQLAEREKVGRSWRTTPREARYEQLVEPTDTDRPLSDLLPDTIERLTRQRVDEMINELQNRRERKLYLPSELRSEKELEEFKRGFYPAAHLEFYLALIEQCVIEGEEHT
jgi:hypothetical protein